jgi:hypothetical protein
MLTVNPVLKSSEFISDEKLLTGIAGLVPAGIVCRFPISQSMANRAIYLFVEALTTVAGEDYQVDMSVDLYRNSGLVYSFPAAIGDNTNNAGVILKSQLSSFVNVVAGQNENILAVFASPQVGGANSSVVSPQKVVLDADEILLRVISSKSATNSFASFRALLAVRSSR